MFEPYDKDLNLCSMCRHRILLYDPSKGTKSSYCQYKELYVSDVLPLLYKLNHGCADKYKKLPDGLNLKLMPYLDRGAHICKYSLYAEPTEDHTNSIDEHLKRTGEHMKFIANLEIDDKDFTLISMALETFDCEGMEEDVEKLIHKLITIRFRATY